MCLCRFLPHRKGLLRGGDNRQFFLKKRGRRPGTSTGLHSSEQQQRKHCDKDTKRQKPVLLSGHGVNQKKNEISKFPSFSISKFFCFFEISSEEISKFGKNRNARTSATTSVENDQPKSLWVCTIVDDRADPSAKPKLKGWCSTSRQSLLR